MRIAIFSDTFLPQINGVAHVAYASALSLKKSGHEVCVFTVSRKKECEESVRGAFQIFSLPSLPARVYPGERITLPLGFSLRAVRKWKPDIIHSHTPFSVGWEAVLAANIFKIPLVGTHHTFFDHYVHHVGVKGQWAKKISWMYVRTYYNRCHTVVSPSEALASELKLYGLKRPIEILPNGIDTDFFKSVSNDVEKQGCRKMFGVAFPTIVYMGRLSYEKNIDECLAAFKNILDSFPQAHFLVVGDGPERARLEKKASDVGLGKQILFVGFHKGQKLLEALHAADVFVTASTSENMPLSVLEAMAAGLPVVAPRALGMPEIVKDGENGFLVEPHNIKEMAEKIIRLFREDGLRRSFSQTSRTLSLTHQDKDQGRLLDLLYKKIQ